MPDGDRSNDVFLFGVFEADLRSRELRKNGLKVPLQGQPLQVFAILLRESGKVVTREELRQKVWPGDTFVDFDHGLNTAITKIRTALGDSADSPRFVETLPRLGYRFIAPVQSLTAKPNSVHAAISRLPFRRLLRPFGAIGKGTWLAVGMTAMLILGIIVGYLAKVSSRPPSSPQVTRVAIKLEPGHKLDATNLPPPYGFDQPTQTAIAISSDGRFIIYSAIRENPESQDRSRLYLRRIDQLEAKPIAGTEGGIAPFLSPDDRWVGFWADGKLMKVSIDGGVPVTLCDQPGWLSSASWGPDNVIVFETLLYARLYMVSANGGKPEILTAPDASKEEFSHRLPHWLPDGKGVLFTIMREWFDLNPRVAVLDVKARKWRVLLEDAADAHYVPTRHLVFLREGTLMAVPFDLDRREVIGQPIPVVANVMQALNTGSSNTAAGQFSVSNSGSLVYALGGINPDREDLLVWVDQKGNAQPIASFKAPFWAPRLSPDGQRIAYITAGKEWQTWIYDLARGTTSQLIGEGKTDFATWTPDGKRLVFKWWRAGEPNLYWQPADGSSPMERLTTSENHQVPGSFSPDGATLAVSVRPPGVGWRWDIDLLDLKSKKVTPFLNSKASEMHPEFSPDGHWMAYVSDESGQPEVYVRPFPGPGGKWQISSDGGNAPLWSRNGKQLFYVGWDGDGEDQYWVADVRTSDSFSASKPRLLFKSADFLVGNPSRAFDISLDGKRFLMAKLSERKIHPVTELILVQNWLEELKRLAPAGKR
jgi:eukaryotic-like serine/threonine-protein kinase